MSVIAMNGIKQQKKRSLDEAKKRVMNPEKRQGEPGKSGRDRQGRV